MYDRWWGVEIIDTIEYLLLSTISGDPILIGSTRLPTPPMMIGMTAMNTTTSADVVLLGTGIGCTW